MPLDILSDVKRPGQRPLVPRTRQPWQSQTRQLNKDCALGFTSEKHNTRPAGSTTVHAVNSGQPH